MLAVAGVLVYRTLNASIVYFILPNEYAAEPSKYDNRMIRLGGLVEEGSVSFDDQTLELSFHVSDTFYSYAVVHKGAPPELFQENTGVVVQGQFKGDTFQSERLLVKHTEQYEAQEGTDVDLERLKETLY